MIEFARKTYLFYCFQKLDRNAQLNSVLTLNVSPSMEKGSTIGGNGLERQEKIR